jgi:hypothetical protein
VRHPTAGPGQIVRVFDDPASPPQMERLLRLRSPVSLRMTPTRPSDYGADRRAFRNCRAGYAAVRRSPGRKRKFIHISDISGINSAQLLCQYGYRWAPLVYCAPDKTLGITGIHVFARPPCPPHQGPRGQPRLRPTPLPRKRATRLPCARLAQPDKSSRRPRLSRRTRCRSGNA